MVDFYGVYVLDGVCIVREYVWRWWNNFGENWVVEVRDLGFIVVIGFGRYFVGGVLCLC